MTIDIFADLLLLPIAVLTWRLSRLTSSAIQFAFIGSVAIRFGIEEARLASLATGLAGAIEMGLVLDEPANPDRDLRRVVVGSILMTSMCADFFSYVANRINGSWTMPFFQIVALLVIGWISWRTK